MWVQLPSANPMETLELARRLISIPSYVGKDCNEQKIAEFLCEYLKQFNWLEIKKQKVVENRFNIIAQDKFPTQLLISGHLDTVLPKTGWQTDPFKPVTQKGKPFGLGSSDMKGSLAALINCLNYFKSTRGLMILLYIDEEYDFLGMKKFIQEYKNKIKPDYVVSGDGYDLKLGNGCRGLIEINFRVKGKTAHASNPSLGKNAIQRSINAVNKLTAILKGETTCNLAFIQGGLDLGQDQNGQLILGKEGNNIADIAEFILDIRPASINLSAKRVISIIKILLKKEGLKLTEYRIRQDFGCWKTSKKELRDIEKVSGVNSYMDIGSWGYIDVALLWKAFNVPCFTFGAGNLKLAHKPNEFISIKNLEKCSKVYRKLIKSSGGGEEK